MISIIIPTLGEAKVIDSTLRALTGALTLEHEIIVSDGGSTDHTVDLARPYADRIVVFAGEGHQTIAQGRNDGAKQATGDFLVFLDADCVIPEPDQFFTRAIARFEHDPTLVGLTAYLRVFPEKETFRDKLVHGIINVALTVANNLLRRGIAYGEFQMIRRTAFARVNGYRGDLVTIEDADMFRRLSRIGRTRIDPNLCVLHSGRRLHQVGWFPLIVMALINVVSVTVRNRAFTKEWKVIR
jgi:glycosyltransferase involved in cell wall biosynthesis